MRRTTPATLALLLTFTLAACAPQAAAPQPAGPNVTQVINEVHYYPRTAGITREYQAENRNVTIRIDELGPTTRRGQLLHATRTYGGGENTTTYRTYPQDGVLIHAEATPSHTIEYNPPMLEYPSELRTGARWSGRTTATLTFPTRNVTEQLSIEYEYTVLERRSVVINDMHMDVYVINLEARHGDEWITQEHWFTPHLGVVRTPNAQFLTRTNLSLPRRTN